MALSFEWDERKNRANRKKHGISFEDAALVFEDDNALTFVERYVEGEQRWRTIGAIGGFHVVVVGHTFTPEGIDQVIRIITARPATKTERKEYEENRS
jgi:uncharacterized DUF497 family protein